VLRYQLDALPDHWALVPVGANKAPYQKGWQDKRLDKVDIISELERTNTRCKAVGVACGTPSGGLLFVDHDGPSVADLLRETFGIEELPETVAVTSGKPGRFQAIYIVPDEFWPAIKTTKFKAAVKGEQLELRWDGAQSVVIGEHPETGSYKWLPGRAPWELDIAEAPMVLVEAMLPQPHAPKTPPTPPPSKATPVNLSSIPLESLVSREHRDWLLDGVAEGGRNDSAYRIACDLMGAYEWARSRGLTVDGDPRSLFDQFVERCSPPLEEREATTVWNSAATSSPTPCLSQDKLENCVAAIQRRQRSRSLPTSYGGEDDDIPPAQQIVADEKVFVPLGYHRDTYFYLPRGQKQVISLSASRHIERQLLAIAGKAWWTRTFPKVNGKTGETTIDWTSAIDWCYRMNHEVGVYDPTRIRGRGCWIDDSRIVFHLGDRQIVDGEQHEVGGFKSEFIYERGPRLQGPTAPPLTLDEARFLIDTAKLMRWEQPASAALLCGWIVLAPVCGALRWRPHIWIVGGAGSGKSTVMSEFVKPLLGGIQTHALGSSTEAGLRQHLGSDAIPLIIDEAENADAFRDEHRIQGIMELARLSSSETGAKTFKGSAAGSATEYMIRSAFLLSSITSSLKQGSDKSRFALLQLQGEASEDPEAYLRSSEQWQVLKERLRKIDAEIGRRLVARTVSLLPTLRQNVEIFSTLAASRFGSQRSGDQFGFLLAGAYSLVSDGLASEAAAEKFFDAFQLEEHLEPSKTSADHQRLYETLLAVPVRLPGLLESSIGVLIEIARDRRISNDIPSNTAADYLQTIGLRIEREAGKADVLLVSNTHPGVKRLLRDTPWVNDWRTVLKQRPGAITTGAKWFAGGHVSKCVAVALP
jgi:putative DNA primase/helicase